MVETNEGGIISVCPTKATDELAAHFEPLKVMYLNSKGGLTTEKGRVIEVINLPYDLESSSHLPWCDRKTKLRMANINSLLEKLPFTSSVVITSADTVLNELFTHKGRNISFEVSLVFPLLLFPLWVYCLLIRPFEENGIISCSIISPISFSVVSFYIYFVVPTYIILTYTFFVRNHFISNQLLESLKFKRL